MTRVMDIVYIWTLPVIALKARVGKLKEFHEKYKSPYRKVGADVYYLKTFKSPPEILGVAIFQQLYLVF